MLTIFGVNFNDAPFMSFPFVWHFRHRLPVWLAMLQMQSLMRNVLCSHSVRSLSNVVVVASMFFNVFFCCCSLYRFGTLYDESESTIFSLFSMKYWLIELTVSISMQYCLSRLFKTPIHELNNELSLDRTFWWTKLSALTVYIDQKFSLEHQCKGLNSG